MSDSMSEEHNYIKVTCPPDFNKPTCDLSPENLAELFEEAKKNYKPPKVVLTVCIIDLRSAFAVNKIRLDVNKLNKDGLECFELSKYGRTSPKYKTGETKYEYLNIPYNNFEISVDFINKYIVPNFEEVWLIYDNDKQVELLKKKYFANNDRVINKWDMHSYTYSPEEPCNPYICNSWFSALNYVL
jgi:hypothetical protein